MLRNGNERSVELALRWDREALAAGASCSLMRSAGATPPARVGVSASEQRQSGAGR